MPTAPSVNGRGKAWLTDGGVVFAEASVSQSNRFAGFFPLPDPQCIARPSPFKVNGDQSTDGGSGYEALRLMPTAPSVKGRRKAWLTDGGAFRGLRSPRHCTDLHTRSD